MNACEESHASLATGCGPVVVDEARDQPRVCVGERVLIGDGQLGVDRTPLTVVAEDPVSKDGFGAGVLWGNPRPERRSRRPVK